MQIELTEGAGSNRFLVRSDTESLAALGGVNTLQLGLSPVTFKKRSRRGSSGALLHPDKGRLRLPGRWQLHVQIDGDSAYLGPVIAVFTSSHRKHARRRFAANSGRFRRFVEQARKMGALAYVFTPAGVRWNNRTITGFTFIGSGKRGRWVEGTFPFPNVVYNRVPTRKAEHRPSVRHTRIRLLREPGLHFFNPKFLDKWQVYQALSNVDGLKQYLPETLPCTGIPQLLPFLRKHRHVYLKMAGGSLGKGTARVDLTDQERFRWRATRGGGHMVSRTLRNSEALNGYLQRLRSRGGRSYLMQKAVPLLQANGRPFDIRALVQKDVFEQWQVTGMAARIAGRGQITTHRPRGGSRAKLVPLIRTVFHDSKEVRRITQELNRVILAAAESFDRTTGLNHGELSMDVGLDRDGHPWILEINAKPAVFDEPAIRKFARRRLLRYCFRKGGFLHHSTPPASTSTRTSRAIIHGYDGSHEP